MKRNIGGWDRILRFVVGILLLGLMFTNSIGLWGWLGVIPLFTALIGWCPLYCPLKINTFKKK